MTNYAPKHSNPHINALPGALGTHAVYIALADGMNCLAASLGKRGAGKMLGVLKKKVRALYKTERKNFELWLRARLQRDDGWRRSVLSDLGGERALRRWERRAAKMPTDKTIDNDKLDRASFEACSRTRRPSGSARTGSGIKTDAQGVFRLAVIKRDIATKPASIRERAYSPTYRKSGGLFPMPGLIGVTPDELRGRSLIETGEIPLSHIAPFDLWAALLGPVMRAFNFIQDLELKIALGPLSSGITPPNLPPHESGQDDSQADYSITHPT